jgi:hypothetical protein
MSNYDWLNPRTALGQEKFYCEWCNAFFFEAPTPVLNVAECPLCGCVVKTEGK